MNPITQLRELESITQKELARLAGISRLSVIRTEQGCYRNIPDGILDVFTISPGEPDEHSRGYSRPSLISAYHHWISDTRKQNYGQLSTELPFFPQHNVRSMHPFISWRLYSGLNSQISIAKLFCVHPVTVSRFELKVTDEHTPPQLVEALLESGYSLDLLNELDERYIRYRKEFFKDILVA